MPRRPSRPAVRTDFECEVDGQVHRGTWELASGMLTVSSEYGSKSAISGSAPAMLARMLLRELVQESKGRGW